MEVAGAVLEMDGGLVGEHWVGNTSGLHNNGSLAVRRQSSAGRIEAAWAGDHRPGHTRTLETDDRRLKIHWLRWIVADSGGVDHDPNRLTFNGLRGFLYFGFRVANRPALVTRQPCAVWTPEQRLLRARRVLGVLKPGTTVEGSSWILIAACPYPAAGAISGQAPQMTAQGASTGVELPFVCAAGLSNRTLVEAIIVLAATFVCATVVCSYDAKLGLGHTLPTYELLETVVRITVTAARAATERSAVAQIRAELVAHGRIGIRSPLSQSGKRPN